ncbi:SMP-30/gluconolactonase/LRE family protein [Leptolyngbya sp. AN02str]|uniref:SMP-30/gluconolactonase/LRE family protein n=1 Tax=Leptolyngbya sp. AN02str TaxID=3423363 RepID=UPI003D320CA6
MMLSYPVKLALESRARLGECPVWDVNNQRLYWVDIYNHRVHEFDPVLGSDRSFDVGDVVGPLAPASNHRLLMAQRDRIAMLNTKTGAILPVLKVEADKPNNRFNDGKCDRLGRFWFGSVSEDVGEASLYRYDPDGSLHLMETGLTISNGLGWSPDDQIFYLTDSNRKTIYAYDFDLALGTIHNRRELVNLSNMSFEPDGLTVDAEGCIWSAMWNGFCVIRFNPDGHELARVDVPVQCPTSCTFGGADLTSLYITSASVGLSQQEIQKSFHSGDLFCVTTNVRGMPTNAFAG